MVKYFVLFFAAACCGGARNVCPEGWIDLTYLDMGCVLLQNATSQLMNNEEAYNYCYDQDARLLEVHDEDQKDQLELVLHHEQESNSFWLGATDLYHEGAWIWGNSMKPVEEFIWEEGEDYEVLKRFLPSSHI